MFWLTKRYLDDRKSCQVFASVSSFFDNTKNDVINITEIVQGSLMVYDYDIQSPNDVA